MPVADRTADYHIWVEGAVAMVESTTIGGVVYLFDGNIHRAPDAMSWVTGNVTEPHDSVAEAGNCYTRWNKGWLPSGALLAAGRSEVP